MGVNMKRVREMWDRNSLAGADAQFGDVLLFCPGDGHGVFIRAGAYCPRPKSALK